MEPDLLFVNQVSRDPSVISFDGRAGGINDGNKRVSSTIIDDCICVISQHGLVVFDAQAFFRLLRSIEI